ncbi:MAG: VOC family protein [Bacteroidota bacterium]
MEHKDNFSHAATVFPVLDLERSLAFYTKGLGFELTFSWEEPVTYAVLKKGGVSLHLSLIDDKDIQALPTGLLYIFVYDVDKIYQRCREQGIAIKNPPALQDYGMTDFDIEDPDGHRITFGRGA